ncbi:MAG TPA: FAD-binding protein, partial [Desulfosporosinus sp.]|nr:FAD-binding protein [Desulfosporosinus sp.]
MWDGIIVGGGLAGLLAGIRASERGKRILIISEGVGSLTYSSGVMDLGDVGGLLEREKHPYTLLGETVIRAGMNYFQTLFPDYQGKWGETQQVLTPLGYPRRAGLVPRGLNAEALQDARQIMLIAPKGMKDFFPEVIKTNLERVYGQ